MVNGTIYIYGGQAKTDGDQKQNTWSKKMVRFMRETKMLTGEQTITY